MVKKQKYSFMYIIFVVFTAICIIGITFDLSFANENTSCVQKTMYKNFASDSRDKSQNITDNFCQTLNNTQWNTSSKSSIPVDLVFVIDSTSSMDSYINSVRKNLSAFMSHLTSESIDLKIGLIDFKDILVDGMDSTTVHAFETSRWTSDIEKVKEELSLIHPSGGGDAPETPTDALVKLTGKDSYGKLYYDWRSNSCRFSFLLTDADYKDNDYDSRIPSMKSCVDDLESKNIHTTVVSENYFAGHYNDLYDRTDGRFFNIHSEDYYKLMIEYADSILGQSKKLTFNAEGDHGQRLDLGVNFGDSLFNKSSNIYSHDLATVGAILCRQIEVSEASIKEDMEFNSESNVGLGFTLVKTGNFDGESLDSPAFAIGYKIINGDQVLICMVVRGTTSDHDKITDIKSLTDGFIPTGKNMIDEFNDAYSIIEKKVSFDLTEENTKVLLTGHSYGGAAVGRLIAEISNKIESKEIALNLNNIYLYTYACARYDIKYASNKENIHAFNIVNKKNDWVPNVPPIWLEPTYSTLIPVRINSCARFGEDRMFNYDLDNESYRNNLKILYNEDDLQWIIDNKDFGAHILTTYLAGLQTDRPGITKIEKTRVVSACCPVDIYVYDKNYNLFGSVINGKVYNDARSSVAVQCYDDMKFVYIPESVECIVKIISTDSGSMKFNDQIFDYKIEEPVSEKKFDNVNLVTNKNFITDLDEGDPLNSKLYVTDDRDIKIREVNTDGTEKEISYDINKAKISDVKDYIYTGKEICPEPEIKFQNKALIKDRDYKLMYRDNIKPGVAKIIVNGIGIFSGKRVIEFKIKEGFPPKPKVINIPGANFLVYNGLEQIGVNDGDDYTVINNKGIFANDEYKAVVSLNDVEHTIWSDGTIEDKEINWSIQKAKLTASYNGETINLGDKPKLEVDVTGFVADESAETAKGYIAPKLEEPKDLQVGEYTLTPMDGYADNYEFSYVSGTLKVVSQVAPTPQPASDVSQNNNNSTSAQTSDNFGFAALVMLSLIALCYGILIKRQKNN